MSGKKRLIEKTDLLIIGGILLLMMIVGSIWDYPISLALYDQSNWFGNLFAAFGETIAMLGVLFSGITLILGHNKQKKGIAALQIIGGCLIVLLGLFGSVIMPSNYLPFPLYVNALPGIALSVLVILYAVKLSKTADRATMVRVALTIFVIILAEMVFVNIVKIPWGRPRMRLIAEDIGAVFTPWWVPGTTVRDALMASHGIASDEFKSFPSGHTANGAAAIWLTLLPLLDAKLKDKKRLLLYIGVCWGLLVALSRIIMGAHFVTDTTVGFAITVLTFLLFTSIMLKDKSLKDAAGG